jgi:tetrathionate reductase subunit B
MNTHQPVYKMALDVERCIGCHACSVACKVENNVPLGRFRTKVYYLDQGKFPKTKRFFLPTLCMQCEDTPCLNACDNKAIERGADGIVRVIPDKCDHLGACETACPYAAIGCDENDVADKCDFCSHRLKENPTSAYSKFMAKHGSETAVLKPEEKTKPSVVYKGHNKAMESKIPKGKVHDPFSYEIETWTSLEPTFPKRKRVIWAKVDANKNITMADGSKPTGGVA